MKVGKVLVGISASVVVSQASTTHPNVIVVLVDDLGLADVSYSSKRLNEGFAPIDTPELDELAEDEEQSAQFVNAFTHMICGPSRSALVTGRLSHSLGNPFAMLKGGGLDPKYKTIGHEFKQRGYSTHFVGKWGIDYPVTPEQVDNFDKTPGVFAQRRKGYGPTERGFDTFYGIYSSGHNHFTKELLYTGLVDWHSHNQTHKLDYPDVDHEPHEYSTHLFTREAIRAMDSWSAEAPGFLHLSYTAPHDPLQAPQKYLDSPSCVGMQNWRRRTFCGMVVAVDQGIGEIKRALKAKGLADNTIILFASDNGGAPTVGGFNYPYRGQKATIYNGGVRTPAFVHVPKGLGAKVRGNRFADMIHIADFGPTLLGIVDRASGRADMLHKYTELGSDIDGVDHTESFLGQLGGKTLSGSSNLRQSAVLEYNIFMQHSAYVEGDWKLILGNPGRDHRFFEPNGTGFDAEGRVRYTVEEFICDLIDRGLGDNWFIYSWAWRALVDLANNMIYGGGQGAEMLKMVEGKTFGDALEVTRERLPTADWARKGAVQLYNLKTDPYEDNDVALEHREMVEEMIIRLRQEVKNDDPHNFSVQLQFMRFMITIVKVLVGLVFAFVALCIYALFRSRTTNVKKVKTL